MAKIKKALYFLTLTPLLAVLVVLGWFILFFFEKDAPVVQVHPLPLFLSSGQKFTLTAKDEKRGLKGLKVTLEQGGKEFPVYEERFPFDGFLNRRGRNPYTKELIVDPVALKLAQGEAVLHVQVRDYSRRKGGDGNLAEISHKVEVDTIPPALTAISRMHYVNVGGTGFVLYQTSPDTDQSGVMVGDLFFPGYPVEGKAGRGIHGCLFAVPIDNPGVSSIVLWAKDKASNTARSSFYVHVRKKTFREDKMDISDSFLAQVLPYFSSFYSLNPSKSDIERYLLINNSLRKENHASLAEMGAKTGPERLWQGPWLRLANSAPMAQFGDHRTYFHKGEKVDEQTHLGVDLASLINSPIQAANHGRVIFADKMGIYGLTVVLDHGQGLHSLYAHLSKIDVAVGREVKKGDILGLSGQTGLAGGDHLHFAVMVNGVFVNPAEWWDEHWIKDNIDRKLVLLG